MTTDAELKAAALAATPGPWATDESWTVWTSNGTPIAAIPSDRDGWPDDLSTWKRNAAYIAAASPDVVLALLARVEAAEADLRLGERLLADLVTCCRRDKIGHCAEHGDAWHFLVRRNAAPEPTP